MANIPSPISGAGGGGRDNPGAQLLMAITQQLLSGLMQRGMNKVLPQQPPQYPTAPPTQQELNRTATEKDAQRQLTQMPGQQENLAAGAAARSGLGNANIATKDVVGLSALPSAASTAPERLAAIQAQKVEEDALATKDRLRARAIAGAPKHLRGVMEMVLNAKEAGTDASTINQLLPQLLPPTDAELIDQSYKKAQTAEINLRVQAVRTDRNMRAELARRIGLTTDSVTDGMITEWMQYRNDAARSKDPQAMAERLLTNLISRSVVDPLTGQANPAFSVEDAATRTEAGMKFFDPSFTLQLTPEQRQVAEAGGILRAAVAREKLSNPSIKPDQLSAILIDRFMGDGKERWPSITADRFQDLLAEAIKSNLLTGL